MNQVVLIGNLTSDIHYDEEHEFLRLILMAGRPRIITGLRVLLIGPEAGKFRPCVRRGSEIGLVGYLRTRTFQGKTVMEIVVNHLVLLRNTNLAGKPPFVVGTVKGNIQLEWKERASTHKRIAILSLTLCNEDYPAGLEVFISGALAELVHPYLRQGSVIGVGGRFQPDGEAGMVAQHLALLQNINWAAQVESGEEPGSGPEDIN